jgi:hypothetical protein
MTLFDKVLINLHRGFEKLKFGAVVFSERVRFELNVIRMRIRVNELRARAGELYARIGQKAAGFRDGEARPEFFEDFLKDDEVMAAIEEIAKLNKEIDEITADLAREEAEVAVTAKKDGEEPL